MGTAHSSWLGGPGPSEASAKEVESVEMALRQQSSGSQRPRVFWKESDLLAHNYSHIKQEEVKGKEREIDIKQSLNSK